MVRTWLSRRAHKSALLIAAVAACGHTKTNVETEAMDGSSQSGDGGSEGRPDGQSPRDGSSPAAMDGSRPTPTGTPCGYLAVMPGQKFGNFSGTMFSWPDARCETRTASMVANDTRDPTGKWGGYMRSYTYHLDKTVRTCTGENDSHPGFGFVVAHWGNTATVGHGTQGTVSTPFWGSNHAIHRYTWQAMSIDSRPVKVTIDWLFAAGRDHPLWTITYDMSALPADAINADTRSPYGDIAWDGGGNNSVAGVGWGDRYKFRSLGSPLSLQSGWDYSQPNTIPYAMEWSTKPDAEMGLVQSRTYLQKDAGGYWAYRDWGKRNESGPMPEQSFWPYQLNQYELPSTDTSKRLAWGANYGAVGKKTYPAYGDDKTLSGWPYQSYSVYVVFGAHSKDAVGKTVTEMENVQQVHMSATTGSVDTQGPAGVGRTDMEAYAPAGWDHVYGAFTGAANGGRAVFKLAVPAPLLNPLFHVRGTFARSISLDGQALVDDVDYLVSNDPRDGSSWLTLLRTLNGNHELTIAD